MTTPEDKRPMPSISERAAEIMLDELVRSMRKRLPPALFAEIVEDALTAAGLHSRAEPYALLEALRVISERLR